jgi:hypothetical protein
LAPVAASPIAEPADSENDAVYATSEAFGITALLKVWDGLIVLLCLKTPPARLLLQEVACPGLVRAEVIRSCDPFEDNKVLKAAWNDPNEDCRQVAREQVGGYTKFVGVSDK